MFWLLSVFIVLVKVCKKSENFDRCNPIIESEMDRTDGQDDSYCGGETIYGCLLQPWLGKY